MSGGNGDGFPGSRWIPAHADRFTVGTSRTIEEIVLHITEGGTDRAEVTAKNAFGGPKYLQGGHWKAQAAHYVVGRDGTVVQCVRHKDLAHHAGPANGWTIGIEHNTRSGTDSKLTAAQYLKSAELVVWLCRRLGLSPTRNHISGHSEVDPGTSHSSCPGRVLKWPTYMAAIDHVLAVAQGRAPMRLWDDDSV
ncbi:MAG: peptidoglycan recognition protein family protein [Planctomycetes bacterium]|jgi:N-acetyl-anhydromuramyl-L-alanine amidase AmpD|nr:peptidoglycan recognition protein family protein [Planctomycetota bacterium]